MKNKLTFFAAALMMAAVLVSCNMKPSMDYVRLCNNPDYDITCPEDQKSFNSFETKTIYLTAVFNHIKEGSKLSVSFYYQDETNPVRNMDVVIDEGLVDEPVNIRLDKPATGWQTGEYKVVLALDDEDFEPIEKTFTIE